MGNKSTKQRLDELYDLLKSEYITESEFRTARSNILRENGFDLSPASRRARVVETDTEERHASHRGHRSKEEDGCGCGCFLFSLFLIVALALGALFIIPDVPDRFGGRYIHAAREWISGLRDSFFPSGFPFRQQEPTPSEPTLPSRDVAPRELFSPLPATSDDIGATPPVATPSVDATPETAIPLSSRADEPETTASADPPETEVAISTNGNATLPSPNLDLPPLPDGSLSTVPPLGEIPSPGEIPPLEEEPAVTIIEIPPSSTVTGESSAPDIRRGSIKVNSARIRSTPDASVRTNVVGWGRNGDRFLILEEGTDGEGAKWYRVRYEKENKEGWISASLVRMEQ